MGVLATAAILPDLLKKHARGFSVPKFNEICGKELCHPLLPGIPLIPVPALPTFWEIRNESCKVNEFKKEIVKVISMVSQERNV